MPRKRYRIILEVLSNMDGDPPQEREVRILTNYLESLNGIGKIEVCSCEPISPSPPPASLTWASEAPTVKSPRKKNK